MLLWTGAATRGFEEGVMVGCKLETAIGIVMMLSCFALLGCGAGKEVITPGGSFAVLAAESFAANGSASSADSDGDGVADIVEGARDGFEVMLANPVEYELVRCQKAQALWRFLGVQRSDPGVELLFG